jgi:hypothetical protein
VIRVGTLEMLEKTKPIRLSKPRRKLISVIALLVLLAVLAVLWYIFFSRGHGNSGPRNEIAIPETGPESNVTTTISEIDSFRFNGQGVVAADCRFLSGNKLHAIKDNRLIVFSLDAAEMRVLELGADEQVVPSADGEVYLLRRAQTLTLGYQLIRQRTRKTLLLIQHDEQLLTKETKPNSVAIYKTPGLQSRILADYIDENIFIFHDLKQYYAIANWQTPEGKQFQFADLAVTPGSRLFFKSVDGLMTMLYHNPEDGRIAVFSIKGIVGKIKEYPGQRLSQQPLMLEYLEDQTLISYYPDQCVEIRADRKEISHRYFFNNYQIKIVKVLLDMNNGRKLIVNDGNKFFTLLCE